MSRSDYYEDLKRLALQKRAEYGVMTAHFGLSEVRLIYKREGIRIDHWPLPRKIKALYMCDDGDCSVALQPTLPYEPKLFAIIHELKHHYQDRAALGEGVIACGDYDANELIEKGAEVFAAEFIYPEAEFAADLHEIGVTVRQASDVVHIKRFSKARVSYRFICKRLERLGLIGLGQFEGVQFQNLEDKIYGVPFYRRRP
ncbi:MAG: ImmA/IrrE family metallo-endopeptidase [Terriglobia bacterium]